jgi:hypothetical protein
VRWTWRIGVQLHEQYAEDVRVYIEERDGGSDMSHQLLCGVKERGVGSKDVAVDSEMVVI